MRSLIIIGPLVAVTVMLCLVACPKGHKSYGGSSGGGLFGGGVPQAQGEHWDIGRGWDEGIGQALVPSGYYSLRPRYVSPEEFERISVQCTGRVRFGVRLTPSEQQAGGLVALFVGSITVFRFDVVNDSSGEGQFLKKVEEILPVDKSDYDKGYVLLEFTVQPGRYGLVNGSDILYFRK